MHYAFYSLALLAGGSAHAADGLPEFDVQNVRPTIDSKRTLLTDDAGLAPSNTFMSRFVLSTARDMLTFAPEGGTEVSVLKDLITGDFIFGYTVSRFRLGLDVPVVFSSTSDVLDGGGGLGGSRSRDPGGAEGLARGPPRGRGDFI